MGSSELNLGVQPIVGNGRPQIVRDYNISEASSPSLVPVESERKSISFCAFVAADPVLDEYMFTLEQLQTAADSYHKSFFEEWYPAGSIPANVQVLLGDGAAYWETVRLAMIPTKI